MFLHKETQKNLNVTKCKMSDQSLSPIHIPHLLSLWFLVNVRETFVCCLHLMLVMVGGGRFFLWAPQNCLHKTIQLCLFVELCLLSDHNSSFLRISFSDFLAVFFSGFLLATLSSFFSVFFFSSFCFDLSASLSYKIKEKLKVIKEKGCHLGEVRGIKSITFYQ